MSLNWGVIGSGMISEWVVQDLLYINQTKYKHTIVSIGSSSQTKGEDFWKKMTKDTTPSTSTMNHGVIPRIATYDEVYADPEVDLIYIGLPHSMHYEACIKALNEGKHVLCEKAFTINSKQAQEVYDLAKSKNLFIMEGMWTKFFPLVQEIQSHVFDKETIGDIYRVFVDFAFDANLKNLSMDSRMKNPKFGAGALLDVGVYMLTYGRIFLDQGKGSKHRKFQYESLQSVYEGIDYMSSVIMKYEADEAKGNGIEPQCILTSSFYTKGPQPFCKIEGSKGRIEIWGANQAAPEKYQITFYDSELESIIVEKPHPGRGFYYEADEVAECISKGKLESDVHPWEENMLIMNILDSVRAKGGVVYPQD